jgi:thiol-disulfide isomerase/thioredoxin
MRRNQPAQTLAGAVQRMILVATLLAGCSSTPSTASAGRPGGLPIVPAVTTTPEMSRDFTLTTLDGDTLTLSDLRGDWVVLNFWATWCPPCVEEMPYLNQIAAERAVHVLGVNFNEDESLVRQFVADHAISFPILMQPDDITLLVYGVRGLPRTVVIAPDGTIAHTIIGQIAPAALDAWLDAQQVPHRQN